MKIYLGGKIRGHHKGPEWRHLLVASKHEWVDVSDSDYMDEVNGIELLGTYCGFGGPPDRWPVLSKAIFGEHDYVGPFVVGCDHGCYHAGNHATSNRTKDASERVQWRQQIVDLCMDAMKRADVIFFWLDAPECYGTITEIVTACHLKNSSIFIATPPEFSHLTEMWFPLAYAASRFQGNHFDMEIFPGPVEALRYFLEKMGKEPESPIEQQFYQAWIGRGLNGIVCQHNVDETNYRVDFAFPDDKIAIELDGYAWHNSKEQFTKDRKRQRELETLGWRIIRFSGSEIYNDVNGCIDQILQMIERLRGEDE